MGIVASLLKGIWDGDTSHPHSPYKPQKCLTFTGLSREVSISLHHYVGVSLHLFLQRCTQKMSGQKLGPEARTCRCACMIKMEYVCAVSIKFSCADLYTCILLIRLQSDDKNITHSLFSSSMQNKFSIFFSYWSIHPHRVY